MDTLTENAVRDEIDRELRLVDAAIALVRAGAAVRVTVANLRLGASVLEAARARAGLHRLRVTADWTPGDVACALVVDRGAGDG
jgi:hypothetical protein